MTTWLITGIGSGFGREIAKAALDRGDIVVGTTRKAADAGFEAMAPGRAHVLTVDLTDDGSVQQAVAQAEEITGGIDRLVNNAGYCLVGTVEEVSMEEAKALFEINVFGAWRMIAAVLPGMRRRGSGHIVNITSVSGFAPWGGTATYGASKYALECIGQTLRQEVGPLGIGVTNVEPGSFRTGFASKSMLLSKKTVPVYRENPNLAPRDMPEHGGKEAGDPALAAQAILAALDSPEPPLHLLLGEDALHYARDQFAFINSQIDEWEQVALSCAYETA